MTFIAKIAIICGLLFQSTYCHALANGCVDQRVNFLDAPNGKDDKHSDEAGRLMNHGADAHEKGHDQEAASYYAKAAQATIRMSARDWSAAFKPRDRAVRLAAALWQSGRPHDAREVWTVLGMNARSNDYTKIIADQLQNSRYKDAFEEMSAHFDDYFDPTAANLMDIDRSGPERALNAGAAGKFADAYRYTQSQNYRCYGPDRIVDLITGMALMAQRKPNSAWMPLILKSSVRTYIPSPDVEDFGQASALDIMILKNA